MSTAWRVLGTEVRRGPAPLAAILTAAAGVLIVQGESFGARWMSLASAVQYSLFLVAPMAMAVAVWHGGRERRRKLGELLESTSRPALGPVTVSWAGVTIGAFAGLFVVVGFGAVQVAPRASYWGGGWWWLLIAALAAIAVVTAVGMLIGHLLPYCALAPVAAIGMYAVGVLLLDGPASRIHTVSEGIVVATHPWSPLIPLRRTNDLDGFLVTIDAGLATVVWLAALAVAASVARAASRIAVRVGVWVLPVAMAMVANSTSGVVEDAVAFEPVCDGSERPVCVERVNAYALDDARELAGKIFDRWEGIQEAPTGARSARLPDVDRAVVRLSLHAGEWTAGYGVTPECDVSDAARAASSFANGWSSVDSRVVYGGAVRELRSWSEAEQRDWITRYVAAADDCDEEELIALAEELS